MNVLQNKLLENFGLKGGPLVVSKRKCPVNVLLPVLLVEWFERPSTSETSWPSLDVTQKSSKGFDIAKFRAISYH
jgi:hypothetical protein